MCQFMSSCHCSHLQNNNVWFYYNFKILTVFYWCSHPNETDSAVRKHERIHHTLWFSLPLMIKIIKKKKHKKGRIKLFPVRQELFQKSINDSLQHHNHQLLKYTISWLWLFCLFCTSFYSEASLEIQHAIDKVNGGSEGVVF